MRLCFGVFASIVKMAALSASNKKIVCDLISTVDPQHHLDSDDAVSKLINCKNSLPDKEKDEGTGAVRKTGGALTLAVPKSYSVDPDDLAIAFESTVVPTMKEDMKAAAIGALHFIIRNDDTLQSDNRLTLENCMGMELKYILSTETEISLPRFLAGLFLFTLRINQNSLPECRETISALHAPGFFDQFKGFLVTYCNEAQKGFIPAPDNCAAYLDKLREKYSHITTLIYRGAPHPFYEVYVPGTVKWKNQEIDNLDIHRLLKISEHIIFTGVGGQGKTMLMRHLLLNAIDSFPDTRLVPIFISVKDFDGIIPDILQCAHAYIRNLWPELSMDELQTMFIDGKAILFFDGLDEINAKYLASFTSALNAFLDRYTDNAVVLSSRPYENYASFDRCQMVRLQPFSCAQAIELISRIDYPEGKPEVNFAFRERLEAGLYDEHKGITDNPLLLSIMLLTYEEYKEIPSKIHKFYDMAYRVLSKLHDKSKGNYERPLATGWSADDFSDRFGFFCTNTYREGITALSYSEIANQFGKVKKAYGISGVDVAQFITDLCDNICLMTYDGSKYTFIHRSFQEYFTAQFFSHQDGGKLERIIPLFDQRKEKDSTLMMLYDMKPGTVEDHIFFPYLEKLVDENENIWSFLETVYPDLECGEGERSPQTEPASSLYRFIRQQYGLSGEPLSPDNFPVLEHETLDVFVYHRFAGETVTLHHIPNSELEFEDESEIVGIIYHFDWKGLRNSEQGSSAVYNSPLMREFEAVKALYQKLAASRSSEDDFMDDMR